MPDPRTRASATVTNVTSLRFSICKSPFYRPPRLHCEHVSCQLCREVRQNLPAPAKYPIHKGLEISVPVSDLDGVVKARQILVSSSDGASCCPAQHPRQTHSAPLTCGQRSRRAQNVKRSDSPTRPAGHP